MTAGQRPSPELVGLPVRAFLYTVDQIATMLNIQEARLKSSYLHFDGRSIGVRPRDKIMVRNIAPQGTKPEWRATEQELIRWLRYKGFKVYDRGWATK